jgi:type III pantothenate kinase
MPGIQVSLQALAGSAAQLSDIPLSAPEILIGRDSAESVRSGVVIGHCLMVDGFLRNIRESFAKKSENSKFSLISTGGLSNVILPHLRNRFTNIEPLTLLGAAKIFALNYKKH